ncbi:metallophosphoesterase [Chloroflexota bacterium]
MKILAISDHDLPQLQNLPNLSRKYGDVDLVISCGDLHTSYIEFVTSVLNVPFYYVRGNHDTGYRENPPGGDNLHQRFLRYKGLWMAGLEGCRRYNRGPIQYTEAEMFAQVLSMSPGMLLRRVRWGTGVDVMVTHASPFGIHDRSDLPHVGFRAFRLLMFWYRPRYLIHGHVDVWDRRDTTWTEYLDTQVVNINPMRVLTIDVPRRRLFG